MGHKAIRIPALDPRLTRMERAAPQSKADVIEAKVPRLREIAAMLQERNVEIAKLQQRACELIGQDEPEPARRLGGTV